MTERCRLSLHLSGDLIDRINECSISRAYWNKQVTEFCLKNAADRWAILEDAEKYVHESRALQMQPSKKVELYQIYMTADQRSLIESVVSEMNLKEAKYIFLMVLALYFQANNQTLLKIWRNI